MCLCLLQNEINLGILLVILLFSSITKGALLPAKTLSLQETNLVRCLTHISHRYFASGRTLVISSPANYRDVQQELIGEFHRTSLWPLVVNIDGNISKPDETDFIDRDGSYIILLPDGNFKRFASEINGKFKDGTIFKRLWNSEARFVVAGANEFSVSQQREIFDSFSKLGIYNCIIVSREHHVTDKEYGRPIKVNDVDPGMKLVVYTWFPYQSSDRCTEVNDITLLESWVISAQGHFTNNTDLFPGKIGKNLKGCPMKAIVMDGKNPFSTSYVEHTYSNGSVVRYIQGVEYDLLRVVLYQMNMTFVPVQTTEEEGYFYHVYRSFFEKKPLIIFGGLGKTFSLNSNWDCTNSYYFTSYRWYVPCSIKYPRWSSMFRIFSVEMWLVLIISIVTATILITLVGRYSCTSEWQVYKTLTSSLTNLWAVILGVSVSTMPRTPSLRSLFLAWVCFSVAFSTVFLAFLTTFLIDSGYKTPIKTVDELFTSGIKLAYPTQFSGIIENGDETEVSKVLKNRVDCPSFHDCMKWAMYQKNMSIMFSDITAEYYYATGFFWREIGTLVVQVRRRCIFSSWSHHDNVSWTPTNEAS